MILHTTVIQRLRHGAVLSIRANPFLRNKSRLKSFRPSPKTGLKPPVFASRSIVSACDYYLLANTSFGMEATVNFSVARQVYFKSHTMISGTVPGIFPGIVPGFMYSESI